MGRVLGIANDPFIGVTMVSDGDRGILGDVSLSSFKDLLKRAIELCGDDDDLAWNVEGMYDDVRYPFMIPLEECLGLRVNFTFDNLKDIVENGGDVDFDVYDFLHEIPDGWRTGFGLDLAEDLLDILVSTGSDLRGDLVIEQVKEKFGSLRFYYRATERIDDIIFDLVNLYEVVSAHTCVVCGDMHGVEMSKGWMSPYCRSHLDMRPCYPEDDGYWSQDSYVMYRKWDGQDTLVPVTISDALVNVTGALGGREPHVASLIDDVIRIHNTEVRRSSEDPTDDVGMSTVTVDDDD